MVCVRDPANCVHKHRRYIYKGHIWKMVEELTSNLAARELNSKNYSTVRYQVSLLLNYIIRMTARTTVICVTVVVNKICTVFSLPTKVRTPNFSPRILRLFANISATATKLMELGGSPCPLPRSAEKTTGVRFLVVFLACAMGYFPEV